MNAADGQRAYPQEFPAHVLERPHHVKLMLTFLHGFGARQEFAAKTSQDGLKPATWV